MLIDNEKMYVCMIFCLVNYNLIFKKNYRSQFAEYQELNRLIDLNYDDLNQDIKAIEPIQDMMDVISIEKMN